MASETVDEAEQTISIKEYLNEVEEEELIVELWTKRNFKCDCGNSKFGEFFCKLFPSKDVENVDNSYNHNFKGLYCSCNRPYPDPDVEEQVEMIQCCMCEDWFHEEHIGLESSNEIPRDEEGEPLCEDFICNACSAGCSFLTLYPQTIWAAGVQHSGSVTIKKDKDVMQDIPSACGSGELENDIFSVSSPKKDDAMTKTNSESLSGGKGLDTGESSEKKVGSNHCNNDSSSRTTCLLGENLMSNLPILPKKALFLAKNWRDILCRCEKCLDMYNQKHMGCLVDKEDSIAEYERTAKQKREEKLQQQEGAELSFLNKLGHVEKMEILNGIADMKNEFRTFLESFDPSNAITSADVQQIFENLAKKRRRV
ncbi:putative E3 ubiquitin-protein ligase UBR7 isoform X2 [Mangifera indica]|uniref:putative E3 ubiquitin-protein ligase UBR7 isoform X2 n=1 Tax=Mangifera indica TaxID=29780 RepID=UPI001CF937A7|nr:putative E3 ubiquitin-protein ligase UBR7 isoform X2 [Mangifera indica]